MKAKATLRWVVTTVVDRVLYKRDERNFDRGMLAGLDTAYEAIKRGPAPQMILQAREGYEHEMSVRER
jgi:hypothetical protein